MYEYKRRPLGIIWVQIMMLGGGRVVRKRGGGVEGGGEGELDRTESPDDSDSSCCLASVTFDSDSICTLGRGVGCTFDSDSICTFDGDSICT